MTIPASIACIGGGPAGLYFAILMKKRHPTIDITVYERNKPYDTFGWGVVFSDQTLQNLAEADEESRRQIIDSLAHWDQIDVQFGGRTISSGGHGFCGIERKRLLNILQRRAEALSVKLVFQSEIASLEDVGDADLIIASDGINSRIRGLYADHFQPDLDWRHCKFTWLGTHRLFEAFTFIFKNTEWGWFQAHAYRFSEDASTFIVETTEEAWRAAGLEKHNSSETIAFLESLFETELAGESLMTNAAHLAGGNPWISFPRVSNRTWIKNNLVLMGDAAHSAHFSIGSGTKLALEDAIALAAAFDDPRPGLSARLQTYEETRKLEVLKLQSAARNSTEWFENVARYENFAPEQFAYSLLTRSQRVSHENLRLRDPDYLRSLEQWFAGRSCQATGTDAPDGPIPPMFTPYKLRGMNLPNRIVVSPMATYSAEDGVPGDFHMVHLGSRALGGAGLIFTEMTCVTPEGRITPGCTGLWNRQQLAAWQRIVGFVHNQTDAKICLQLGHSGPKGSTQVGWEGMDKPLAHDNWPIVAPSPIPWSPENQIPTALTPAGMESIVAAFRQATQFAVDAGFDMLELHAAHGYLLSAFLTPLSNRREDAYGGSLENRLRFPLQVFAAMRTIWPQDKPMSVRLSATDWHPNGNNADDAVAIAAAFKDAGVDMIDVSAGQTTPDAEPVYGRMFQTPFSDRIRNDAAVPTMAVGNIYETDHANSIIAAGRADLVALARPHLANPNWTLHAAAELGYEAQPWPKPYLAGRDQYVRNLQRTQEQYFVV